MALAVAAMLLLMLFAGTILTTGQHGFTGLVIGPGPAVSPAVSADAAYPLASPLYDIVGIADDHLFTILSDGAQRKSPPEAWPGRSSRPSRDPTDPSSSRSVADGEQI